MLSCSLTSTPSPISILWPVCRKHLEKSGFDEEWKVATLYLMFNYLYFFEKNCCEADVHVVAGIVTSVDS